MAHSELLHYRDSRRLRGFVWRGLALTLVFGAGLTGFLLGVDVTDRPGVADASLGAKIYYSVGLFVLGGLDLGVPVGGPVVGRGLLWFAYFTAPALTASAVIEGILRVVNPGRWQLRGLRNHIVIGGCGRLAMMYLRHLRDAKRERAPVVVIDSQHDHPYRLTAESMRARFVAGNITAGNLLGSLGLARARRVLLLTGDDFANLNAASKILAAVPQLEDQVVVHVSDLRFKRLMAKTTVANNAHVFNIYQSAAIHLVEAELLPYFELTEFSDILVMAGFGRLGQTILGELQRRAPDSVQAAIIVDVDADERVAVFDEQVGFHEDIERHVIEGDASAPRVWSQVESLYDFADRAPAFLLVSGDDSLNLRLAMTLSERYPDALVLARNYYPSQFADEVSAEAGFRTFSVAEYILDSMPGAWFE